MNVRPTARDIIREKLAEKLTGQSIELVSEIPDAPFAWSFLNALEPLTDKLHDFYIAHDRVPNVIFNDGVPSSWKSALESKPGFNTIIGDWSYEAPRAMASREVEGDDTIIEALLIFACKYYPKDGVTRQHEVVHRFSETQEVIEIVTEPVIGPVNLRGELPRNAFEVAAFQTWGLLMLLTVAPETVFATDEGFMITVDGAGVLERTLAYYAQVYGFGFHDNPDAKNAHLQLCYQQLGAGPMLPGIPYKIAKPIRERILTVWAQNDWMGLKQLAGIFLSFVAFYFGAAGASGLVMGQFTLPNLTSAIKLANTMNWTGSDSSGLTSGLKVVSALTGDVNFGDTLSNTGASAMDDWDLWSSIGIDPGTLDYSMGSEIDWGQDALAFQPTDWDMWAEIGINPDTLDYSMGETAFDADFPYDEWGAAQEGFGAAPEYDAVAIQAENDAALAASVGPVSATQYAAAAKTSASVASAATAAIKSAGGSSTAVTTSPQTAANGARVAQQQALVAAQQGRTEDAGIWATANRLLSMYANYQNQTRYNPTVARLPSSLQYPTTPGASVRQPDGSITIRNPDGTLSTIRPNGQAIMTPQNSVLPDFLAQNKTLLIVGGVALAAVGAILLATSKRD